MIATDLDNVIADFEELLRDEILKLTGYDVGSNRENYYITIPGISDEDAKKIINKIIFDKCGLADEIPGAIESLSKIYKLIKKDILIVTARGPELKIKTEKWLKDHIGSKFPYIVKFSNHKSKNDFFEKDTRFFIDDHPYFVNEAAKKLEHVFLMDKGWNRNIFLKSNVTRIKNIETVFQFLKHLLKMEFKN